MDHLSKGTMTGIALGLAFELAMHVFVHYTIPGANFAAGLAETLAPGLDAVGLTSVFSQSAAAGGVAGASASVTSGALPALDALA